MHTVTIIFFKRDIKCKVPFNTIFNHGGIGVVIARDVKLGDYCIIGQNVTIGGRKGGYPKIGKNVVICPHAIIIGNVRISHHSIIGAGAVVLHDIPPYSLVVGNPAHIIKIFKSLEEYQNYRRMRI